MYAHLTFFHQGYDLFSELQPLMKLLGGQLDQLVVDAAKEKRDMEQKHSTIQQKVLTVKVSSLFMSKMYIELLLSGRTIQTISTSSPFPLTDNLKT